jgi:glucose/arabinose dehydrogenase/PKD repeat protein
MKETGGNQRAIPGLASASRSVPPIGRRLLRLALSLAMVLAALPNAGPRPAAATTLPQGFIDELIVDVGGPTALAFTPDGRMLVAMKPGLLRVYASGSLALIRNALDLQSVTCANRERGMLGIAVDPDFASNRYIYIYYTFKKHGECPGKEPDNPSNPVNRLSRFVLGDNNRVLTTTEVVLIDNIPSVDGTHNGGDVQFGKDGYLYVSVGDNDCNYIEGSLCGAANQAARDENILLGKILRITRDGGIPPDNPFLGPDSARCGTPEANARTEPGKRCQETFAWGLRNPWRMAFDPNAAGTRSFINDVGQHAREEINLGQAGADYGWPCFEGTNPTNTTGKCSPLPPDLVGPIHEYAHATGCASITGGAFVPNGVWPPEYDGGYLFGDYVCGKIFLLKPASAGGGYVASEFATGLGRNSAVAMTFGPYGNSQALYYTTFAGGGQVRRIVHTQAPVAALSANPAYGALPLTVSFDGSLSYDPTGEALAYDWDFGDGASLPDQPDPAAVHTYTVQGVYTATLVVRDPGGLASAPAYAVIHAGNLPPVLSLTLSQSTNLAVGQSVTAFGSATDPDDGGLPPEALMWEVRLHHVDEAHPDTAHWHPYSQASGQASLNFSMPPPEDLNATALSYVEVLLTAVDSHGLTASVSSLVAPLRVPVRFDTVPPRLALSVNAQVMTAPRTLTLWHGWTISLTAPLVQTGPLGDELAFQQWSDGAPEAARWLTAPGAPACYAALYQPGTCSALFQLFLPYLGR